MSGDSRLEVLRYGLTLQVNAEKSNNMHYTRIIMLRIASVSDACQNFKRYQMFPYRNIDYS